MPSRVLRLLFALCTASCANAQQDPSPIQPKTKLEAFQAQDGVVIVRGFSQIGEVRGQYGSTVTLEVKEFTNAASAKRELGMTIVVKETLRLERENTSYIDYDEIPSLLAGIDYIAKVTKTATKLDNFQADYRTKGDLRVSTFNDNHGETLAAVASGRIGSTSAYFKLSELAKFRQLVADAKSKLDGIK
jgi:hypothetical protein